MKDILFEKYREILDKDIIEIEPYLFYATVACANTTKEIAKGFAEWASKAHPSHKSQDNAIFIEGEGFWWYRHEKLTTEELLEKYLETLNQK